MIIRHRFLLAFAATLLFSAPYSQAQQVIPSPNPSAPDDTVRTVTEEIQLNVTALDSSGRLDPSVELADILVLEDGVAQELRSARRVPAHIVLLLDTGGELNSAKRVRLTRQIAKQLVDALAPVDEITVIQYNNKVEVLHRWTIDKQAVHQALDTRLFSGKRARFVDGVLAAGAQLEDRPQGNRHVVMITDGVQTAGERMDRAGAFKELQAANAVIHVISYTTVSRGATARDQRYTRKRDKSLVPDAVIDSLPRTPDFEQARRAHEPGGHIIDLDPKRRKAIKKYETAMRVSEKELSKLTEDTGGRIWLPETSEEMIDNGADVARLIDSQYVVTYKPKRTLASAPAGEERRIEVASRRVGLNLSSRRLYVVPAPEKRDKTERRLRADR